MKTYNRAREYQYIMVSLRLDKHVKLYLTAAYNLPGIFVHITTEITNTKKTNYIKINRKQRITPFKKYSSSDDFSVQL